VKKEGGASGIVTLEGVRDEEMLDGQGSIVESNRNPDIKTVGQGYVMSMFHRVVAEQ
jgi:hypothetical protein